MIAAAAPSAWWYLNRATGIVTLLALTASVVLGILQTLRWAAPGTPRFVVVMLHRSISLLVVALLGVHVLSAVLDGFAPIRWLDAVLPFAGAYRPLWLGLGALAADLLIALTVTSLLRRRLGLRAWRGVHWLAYACWPVALVHGWGTGSDARTSWMLAITIGCVAVVIAALTWRLAGGWPERRPVRIAAVAAISGAVAFVALWLPAGPLADGWARRAGTPQRLLPRARPLAPVAARTAPPALTRSFTAGLRGTITQGMSADGQAVVDLRIRLTDGVAGRLRVRVAGDPAAGGGVIMRRSAVALGPPQHPGEFQGRIDALDGTRLEALVGSTDGRAVRLRVALTLDGDAVTGTVSGQPVR